MSKHMGNHQELAAEGLLELMADIVLIAKRNFGGENYPIWKLINNVFKWHGDIVWRVRFGLVLVNFFMLIILRDKQNII